MMNRSFVLNALRIELWNGIQRLIELSKLIWLIDFVWLIKSEGTDSLAVVNLIESDGTELKKKNSMELNWTFELKLIRIVKNLFIDDNE